MASRAREGRRGGRVPAIWHGAAATVEAVEGPALPHGSEGRMFGSWRLISLMIVICLLTVLFLFFGSDPFYVHSIAVGGTRYLAKEDVFALTGIANMHIFWVNPAEVRANILRSPTIADAEVYVSWPPNMVQVIVQEREPALVWEQAGVATWIDLQGRVMRQWENRPDLLRIVAETIDDGPLSPEVTLDPAIVNGALQLRELLPNRAVLRYHPVKGLGFTDVQGWNIWFGVGATMPERILIYNAVVDDLQARGIHPSEINVVNPDAPYYCSLIEGCPGGGT